MENYEEQQEKADADFTAEYNEVLKQLQHRDDVTPVIFSEKPRGYLTPQWNDLSKMRGLDYALLRIKYACEHEYWHQFPLTPRAGYRVIEGMAKRPCPVCGIDKWIAGMIKAKKFEPGAKVSRIRASMINKIIH